MRIFISHPIVDVDLATELKKVLENNKEIEEAYIAVKTPEYHLDIPEKIINQINNSDYLVAIITNNTFQSASVHQEIGYAQGVGITRIPMVEKSAKAGFLHDSKDKITFDRKNFGESCNQVLEYIISHGPTRRKFTTEEEILVKKSAHFRYEIEYELSHFMSSVLVYYQIDPNGERIFFDENGREKAHQILENFIKDREKMYEKVIKLELVNLAKVYSDYILLRRGIEDAKRFPHINLLEDEEDAFLKLTERITHVGDFSIDIIRYLKETLQISTIDNQVTLETIIEDRKDLVTLPRNILSYVFDITILTRAVIDLDRILLKMRRKFGDIAFKDTFDKDSV